MYIVAYMYTWPTSERYVMLWSVYIYVKVYLRYLSLNAREAHSEKNVKFKFPKFKGCVHNLYLVENKAAV